MALVWLGLATTGTGATAWDEASGQVLERTVLPGPGDRFARVVFTCWLPAPDRPVRAVIVHQHGCGNSSPTTNPPVARDAHWQALAQARDCAILVPHYTVEGDCADWNDPGSGSERALLAALRDFGTEAGRPGLAAAPWILWGHSGGSSWSVQMMLRHPGRVLAASLRGGCHRQFSDAAFRARFVAVAREIPLLFVWGVRESVPQSRHHVSWEPMQAMYHELRAAGGRVALAIDPQNEHDCGNARLLVLPYFAAVLSARAEARQLPGVWVDLATRLPRLESAVDPRAPGLAWLPSPEVARQWKMFTETGAMVPARAPGKAPQAAAKPGADGRVVELAWRIEPELDGGVRLVRIYRDGRCWREIGRNEAKFLATNRDSPPFGLHVTTARDETVQPGATHRYEVSFLDVAGVESPRSALLVVTLPGGRDDGGR